MHTIITVQYQYLEVKGLDTYHFGQLQTWLKNHKNSTNTGYYSIVQLSLLLLLNNYQYNCNNTISSLSAHKTKEGS